MKSKTEKLVWYAPKWSSNPKQWWVLRKNALSTGPLVRISVASTIAIIVILVAFKIAVPQLVLVQFWPVVFVLPVMVAGLISQTALLTLFKKRIEVTSKKILITHGQSMTLIKTKWLTGAVLTIHADNRIRLRFQYETKLKSMSRTVGVSEDCDLFRLADILPVEILVRDARNNTLLQHLRHSKSKTFVLEMV